MDQGDTAGHAAPNFRFDAYNFRKFRGDNSQCHSGLPTIILICRKSSTSSEKTNLLLTKIQQP